jgi:four helix bundle protein
METNQKYLNLRKRIKGYALRIINLYASLPKTTIAQVIGKQILRSGTSVGAQFCEGRRAKSPADFVSKNEGSLGELEETLYWLELLVEANITKEKLLLPLMKETDELTAIITSIVKRAKSKKSKKNS